MPSMADLDREWSDALLPSLPQKARARFAGGHWVAVEGDTAVFGLPNAPHAERCEEFRTDLERTLAQRFGVAVPVRLVVDGSAPDPSAPRAAKPSRRALADAPSGAADLPDDEIIDLDELTDATGVDTAGVDRIAAMFPGAELVTDDD